MKTFVFFFACVALLNAAPPKVVSSRWRNQKIELENSNPPVITMTEVTLVFDQDLYVTKGGNQVPLSSINGTAWEEWPKTAYLFQGLVSISCNGKQIPMHGIPSGPPQFIVGLEPTKSPLSTFFGYFAGFFLKSRSAPTTYSVIFLHTPDTNITQQEVVQCAAAGSFKVELAPANCRPSAQKITQMTAAYKASNRRDPIPAYVATDLFCQLKNQAGEVVVNKMETLPRKEKVAECDLQGVNQLLGDLNDFKTYVRTIKAESQLNSLQFGRISMESRPAFKTCARIMSNVVTFQSATRFLGNSQSCSSYKNRTARAFLKDPCCTGGESQCCVGKPVNVTYQIADRVNVSALDAICTNVTSTALTILASFIVNSNKENSIGAAPEPQLLFRQLFWNTWITCVNDNGECTSNRQCYSRICDVQNKRCLRDPNGQALPILRCLVENFQQASEYPILSDLIVAARAPTNLTDPEAIAQAIYQGFSNKFKGYDCIGQEAYKFQSAFKDIRDATGKRVQVVVPGNRTGCLSVRRCNWRPWDSQISPSQCEKGVDSLNNPDHRGSGKIMCAKCSNSDCQNLMTLPMCYFGYGANARDAASCASVNGTWSRQRNACLRKARDKTGDINTCLPSFCPGPNSRNNQWIRQQFQQLSTSNSKGYTIRIDACSRSICYNAMFNRSACYMLRTKMAQRYTQCWQAATTPLEKEACAPWNIWWDPDYKNGAGMCYRYMNSRSPLQQKQQLCNMVSTNVMNITGKAMSLFLGTGYETGQYYTKALCENSKVCQSNNYGSFVVSSDSECLNSKKSCNYGCPTCVNGVANEDQAFCALNLNQTECEKLTTGNPRYDNISTHCVVEVGSNSECAAMNNTIKSVSCNLFPRATCSNTAMKYRRILKCNFRDWTNCKTKADCESQGDCEDWDLYDHASLNKNCGRQGCGICVYDFPRTPEGVRILRCGVPLLNGYPCYNCPNQKTNLYRWSSRGCILRNLTGIQTEASCIASTAPYDSSINGKWMRRAMNKSECLSRDIGCRRPGWGHNLFMKARECNQCKGQIRPLYRFRHATWAGGKLIRLKWMNRTFAPVNTWINTLSRARLQAEVAAVVARTLSRIIGRQLVRSFRMRFKIYQKMIQECNGAVADISRLKALSAEIGSCECFDTGECTPKDEDICPINCGRACTYNTYNVIGASIAKTRQTRRRLILQTDYDIVKDGSGATVGAIVGDAYRFSGNISGTFRLCIPDNVQYTQVINSMYTVYDFSPTNANDQPGIPMGLAVVREGTQTCGNVTVGPSSLGFFPIKRKAQFAATGAPTSATTTPPGMTSTMGSTTTSAGTTKKGSTPTDDAMGFEVWGAIVLVVMSFFVA